MDFIVRYALWCDMAVVGYVSNSNSSSSSRRLQSSGIEVATKSISKDETSGECKRINDFLVNDPSSQKQTLVCSKLLGKSGCWLLCVQCSVAFVRITRPSFCLITSGVVGL